MVASNLDDGVNYVEITDVNPDDIQKEFDAYKVFFATLDRYLEILVGNPTSLISSKNITYFPIYLLNEKYNDDDKNGDDENVVQIGVYEIKTAQLLEYMDEDGEIMFDKLGDPLLFSFVDNGFILKYQSSNKNCDSDDSDSDSNSKNDDIADGDSDDINNEIMLDEVTDLVSDIVETFKDALDIREKYHEDREHTWVQRFMRNPHYTIVKDEMESGNLMNCVSDGIIDGSITCEKLRNLIADNVSEEMYENLLFQYNTYTDAIKNISARSIELKSMHDKLKNDIVSTVDTERQDAIRTEARRIANENVILKKDITNLKELQKEYKYIKSIKTFVDFCDAIRLGKLDNEEWMIALVERLLNIKCIVLSKDHFLEEDIYNVLQCNNGQAPIDPIIQEKGIFTPSRYIILEQDKGKYSIIGYKDLVSLSFSEVPYDLKRMITDKCFENNGGLYSLIHHFNNFKYSPNYPNPLTPLLGKTINCQGESRLLDLYDDQLVFNIYDKSAGHKCPGKGSGEHIFSQQACEFGGLSDFQHWRRKLDDTWNAPFTLDDHGWSSVEHFYQGSKFKRKNPELYLSFSLDSGSDISGDVCLATKEGEKLEKMVDPDFFDERYKQEHRKALHAKFKQNPELKDILKHTRNSKIIHYAKGNPGKILDNLMIVRKELMD